jgi:hypothetical protein
MDTRPKPGKSIVSKPALVAYLLIAVMIAAGAAVFTVMRGNREAAANEETLVLSALVTRTLPGLCLMSAKLEQNDRAEAFNLFYNEVHQGAHVLGARLAAKKSPEIKSFLRAKSNVERDLRTFSPTLKESVSAFTVELRRALEIDRPGSGAPC